VFTEFNASKTLLEKRHADQVDTLVKACEVRHDQEKLAPRFQNRTVALSAEEDTGGRGTERKLEKYPQGVETRMERGGIGGDKWRGGSASKSPAEKQE
jgi:hypothetical protein